MSFKIIAAWAALPRDSDLIDSGYNFGIGMYHPFPGTS